MFAYIHGILPIILGFVVGVFGSIGAVFGILFLLDLVMKPGRNQLPKRGPRVPLVRVRPHIPPPQRALYI
jgi:hypothetical protein